MTETWPAYLDVPREKLGEGTPVGVHVRGDGSDLAEAMADAMLEEIVGMQRAGKPPTLIVPVGPVDHYPRLAEKINSQGISCRDVVFIQMDEYLTTDDRWIDPSHPLSFRGHMARAFYDRLDSSLAPPEAHRVVPDPSAPDRIPSLIERRGGVDVCFGGIGINGHVAFNEPPEPSDTIWNDAFADLPTRVLPLARETRTINAVTVGGEIGVVPRRAVTVGMREILQSRRVRFFCNRPWQSGVVRKALHGPIDRSCPASFLRTHADPSLTVASYVAEPPDVRLR